MSTIGSSKYKISPTLKVLPVCCKITTINFVVKRLKASLS